MKTIDLHPHLIASYDEAEYAFFVGELVKRHNGWTNYETWAVKLWMDNTESIRKLAFEISHLDSADENIAASSLSSWIHAARPEMEEEIYLNLLLAALDDVNWLEIARAYREEKK